MKRPEGDGFQVDSRSVTQDWLTVALGACHSILIDLSTPGARTVPAR